MTPGPEVEAVEAISARPATSLVAAALPAGARAVLERLAAEGVLGETAGEVAAYLLIRAIGTEGAGMTVARARSARLLDALLAASDAVRDGWRHIDTALRADADGFDLVPTIEAGEAVVSLRRAIAELDHVRRGEVTK